MNPRCTASMRLNQQLPDVGPIAEGVILALWKQGLDTLSIAKHLQAPEWQIYNRVFHVREAAR
jgi:hypothetical protein